MGSSAATPRDYCLRGDGRSDLMKLRKAVRYAQPSITGRPPGSAGGYLLNLFTATSAVGPGCVKTCTRKECAELFSPFSLSTVTASTVLFLFNVIETKFLRASPTWEFSHSLGHLRPKSTTQVTSAAPSRAEIQRTSLVVRFVPQADAARGCPARHPESGPRNMP